MPSPGFGTREDAVWMRFGYSPLAFSILRASYSKESLVSTSSSKEGVEAGDVPPSMLSLGIVASRKRGKLQL